MEIRNLFKREEVSRLTNVELREFYIEERVSNKRGCIFAMIISIIITITATSFAIALKMYWILAVSIVFLIGFIINMIRYGSIIEDLFENKIIEGENES